MPYLSFTNLIYEERVKFYDYPPFKQELFNVMYYPAKKKVDHTQLDQKILPDSVVGAAFNAIKSLDKTDINEQSLTDIFVFANSNGEEQYKEAVKSALDNLMNILKNS